MKIDERDTMLSRIRYTPGDGMYEAYYSEHPEHKEMDDQLRAMPGINAPGTPMYEPIKSQFADSAFDFLADIKQFSRQAPKCEPQRVSPGHMTAQIKKLALYLGATDVGIAKLTDEEYYSHRGRTPWVYGQAVSNEGAYGIVLTKEMPREMINRAPHLEEMTAVTKAYMDLAIIGMWLTYYIANLGYEAKNNMDMDYLLYVPRAAELAGLGQVGRAGILVTPEYGMRVRIGVVSTNLPLVCDEPVDYGIKDLCKVCNLCSKHCPSRAIMSGPPVKIDKGIMGYVSNQEKCFKMWKTLGTDCGICLSVCPLSQEMPENVKSQLKTNPSAIIRWHQDHIKKRPYISKSLPLYTDENE